ncbi:MAG: hypothetical protein ACE5NG_13030, partial [bacterium]
ARFWREQDGSANDFAQFCNEQFIADSVVLQEVADRFEQNLEQIYGLNTTIARELHRQIDLDIGPIRPLDMLFAEFDPFAHLNDDFFSTKIAFAALLNFPLYTLEERLKLGANWTREEWARARLVQQFAKRVPAEVQQTISQAFVSADHYINNYNIYMHHLLTPEGLRLFPEGLKLISHWGLRDELKAQYAKPDGLPRQKLIQQVMERIIRQEIPAVVINNPAVAWDPINNTVKAKKSTGGKKSSQVKDTAEKNDRYRHLLEIFHAQQLADPYYPEMPTLMDRRFQEDREIPEKEFEKLLISVLTAPAAKKVTALIHQRLGRELEPFDIWYDGFKVRSSLDEAKLDSIVAERYPTPAAFQADIPYILRSLGFSPNTAQFVSSKITVDPSRGAGHAYGAALRTDNAHLRTRIPATGMNYKGFNIAVHELGHNVEQVFSLNRIDHTLLQGVPNTAFTEGFAFVFQARDLDLLGITQKNPQAEYLKILDKFWSTFEISGVSLVDMYVWHWMYDHATAKPEDLNQALQSIAKNVWNEYYAPVLGMKDQILLGIYSHMIDSGLYLPDYPLGYIISFQIEQYLKDKNLAAEMERMCRLGSITPSAWMQAAVGAPISAKPLLKATEAAIQALQ